MNVGIVFLAFFATLLIGTPIGVGVGLTCLTASASNAGHRGFYFPQYGDCP